MRPAVLNHGYGTHAKRFTQIEDALAVGFAFNTTDRLANAFGFDMLSQEGFEAGAKYLLKRGYA